jgi:hypothetical protein
MADLGKLQTETYLSQKEVHWIAGAFRELAPQVRNLGGKIFGGKVQWIRPQSDEVFAVLDEEPEFAANAFFPVARGYKARNEAVGYTIKIAVWDEGQRRRISIGSQASRQGDRPQASGARRRLVRMLTEVDDTLIPGEPEGAPAANGSVRGDRSQPQQLSRSVARRSRRAPKLAVSAALAIVLLVAAWFTTARSSPSEPTDRQAAGAPAPAAASAGNGPARIPEAFSGTWVGTGYQYDTQSRWTIRMTLRVSGQATAAGRITYPSLACGGVLSLQTVEQGRVRVIEDITDGENACIDHGSIEMRLLDTARLKWQWNHPDGTPGAEAVLSKVSS